MIKCDEDALVCDLAETYQIYNYRSLPLNLVATFSVGLRDNSRIKSKIRNDKVPYELLMQAMIVDRLSLLVWSKTQDSQTGRNKPQSIVELMLGEEKENDELLSFDTPEEFEKARKKILERGD